MWEGFPCLSEALVSFGQSSQLYPLYQAKFEMESLCFEIRAVSLTHPSLAHKHFNHTSRRLQV